MSLIVWTDNFPKHERPLGYLRLALARCRYLVHAGLSMGNKLGLGLPHMNPGYQVALCDLHDKHKGERCFVNGNGPSLREMNLAPLANELNIG